MSNKKKEDKEKPLDKMTVKELREMAKEIPDIVGVHGMNKPELLAEIKKAKGIVEETVKKTNASVREIKAKLKKLRDERAARESLDKKTAAIYRKRINRLKKKTRRAA